MKAAIRSKKDLMRSVLCLIRLFGIYPLNEIQDNKTDANICICVGEMSRCFLIEENKIHSFQIPFAVSEHNEHLVFSLNGESVDTRMCLILENLVMQLNEMECSMEMMLDSFCDMFDDFEIIDKKYRENCWNVFINILMTEGGYIRYDHDLTNYGGKMHPEDHLDVFYSDNCTFKLGLNKQIDVREIKAILNNREDRYFVDMLI